MMKVYQVFVSSTYADLFDERRRVSETLAKAGYIPAGMELFPATDQQQLEFIKRVIDRCDYYVVVVGGRYGSLADDKISFTEKEYEYALERKIPVLAFLHADPDRIESGKTDRNESQTKRLAAFRERLSLGRIVDFWLEPQELCTKVVIAVTQAINLTPGVGWIRGDQAIDPKVLQEMERMRTENEQLKKRLSDLESGEVTFPSELAGPNDLFEFEILEQGAGNREREISASCKFGELFASIANALIAEHSEVNIARQLARIYVAAFDSSNFNRDHSYVMFDDDVERLRFHFEALGLIKALGRYEDKSFSGSSYRNEYIVWSITDKGRRFLSTQMAIRSKRDVD